MILLVSLKVEYKLLIFYSSSSSYEFILSLSDFYYYDWFLKLKLFSFIKTF